VHNSIRKIEVSLNLKYFVKHIAFVLFQLSYEARVLQKWNRTRTGYFLGTCTLGVLLHAYPRRTQIFQQKKKKKNHFLSFFLLDMSRK
jgi:hypothetical protein